jgi:vacuolar iron transporter family protein
VRAWILGWLARRLGPLVVLGLVQRAEAARDYEGDPEATAAMAANEQTHALVVAGLAQRARARSSGWFRAAVFGANDGLVSNFSLVLGMAGAGSSPQVVLLAGLAGLLAGALSMAAGEYISVRSRGSCWRRPPRSWTGRRFGPWPTRRPRSWAWSSGPGG